MSNLFAMQRANGDWFALNYHGRLRVPLFHSFHDAMMARLRNFILCFSNPLCSMHIFSRKSSPHPAETSWTFAWLRIRLPVWGVQTLWTHRTCRATPPSDEYENDGSN